jgi:hypothetical protein
MNRVPKSREELAELFLAEAKKGGKCQNLLRVTIKEFGNDGDWSYYTEWNGGGLSVDCRRELLNVGLRLKKLYHLR